MKVLHYTRDFPPRFRGGISTSVGHMVAELAGLGVEQRVVSFDGFRAGVRAVGTRVEWDAWGPEPADGGGSVRVLHLENASSYDMELPWLARLEPDVVHVHDPLLWPFAERLFGRRRRPVFVYTAHVVHARLNELRGLHDGTLSSEAERLALTMADVVVAPSEAAAGWIRRLVGARIPQVVVPLGVPLRDGGWEPVWDGGDASSGEWEDGGQLLRSGSDRRPDWWLIGRHADIKGTDALPWILGELHAHAPALMGGLVSENPDSPRRDRRWRDRMRELQQTWGNFRLVPWQTPDELWSLVRGGDMVLVPSRCETFSMVTLEAMAVGAVVVARRCGGPEELLEGGVSGVLCDTDAELAQALVGLSRDSSARRRMGEAARRRSREFSSLRTAVQMLELYRLGLETRAQ